MYQLIMLTIFTILCSSCDLLVVTPMPKFQNYEICPSIFKEVEPENSIYEVSCRCAMYNPNTEQWLSKFKPAPIHKCDRAYGIVLEDFKTKFQPDIKELKEWYRDETGKMNSRKNAYRDLERKYKKQEKMLHALARGRY